MGKNHASQYANFGSLPIMLIALGIFLLSMPDDKEDFDLSDTLTCHHPFVQWLRRHHGVD